MIRKTSILLFVLLLLPVMNAAAQNRPTRKALLAENEVLRFSLDSLQTLLSKTAKLQEEGLFAGQLAGIVRTMYDADALQSDEIKNTLQKLGPQLCSTVIPYSAVISEAAALGRPVMQYDKSSNGARAYLALAGELISRLHL